MTGKVEAKFAVGLSMFIGGIATQLGTVNDWSELLTPVFVAGFLVQVSGFILTVWGGMQYNPPRNGKRTRYDDWGE